MARKKTIKLLLINESDNEGERLISLFRNAGRVARAHRAASAEDLHSQLEKNTWDLIIADDNHPGIAVEQCLEQLKKLNPELPVIVIRDNDVQAALDAGACDVVPIKDDARLVFVAFRELIHLEKHRSLDQVQARLKDTEERCELLLAQSQDAIAYVADGMLISSNALFCSRFGYDDPGELEYLPVIDLIALDDHDKVKRFLKAQIAHLEEDNGDKTDFTFTGIGQNAEPFSAAMQMSNAVLDGEPCIQLSVRDESAPANTVDQVRNGDKDPSTGLYNHDYFLDQLSQVAQQASKDDLSSTLLFVGIDCFTSFRSKWGITHAHKVVLDIAHFIQKQSSEASSLAHFCDDGFTLLLPNTQSQKALSFAQALCKSLEAHIIEVDGQSIQCTASIGVVLLDRQCEKDPNVLVENAFSVCELVRSDAENEGVGNGAQVFVPTKKVKSLDDAEGDEELDHILAEALEDGRFALIYQPVVSLRGTSGDHYEVQTVLIKDNGKEVHAKKFLKTLAFSEPNTRLDRWAIIESTKQLASTQHHIDDIHLFINLTPNALLDESLIPWLGVALKAGGVKPESLIFQFSETDIIDSLKPAMVFVEAIKKLGCRLSITEFGLVSEPMKAIRQIEANFAKFSNKLTQELFSDEGGDTEALKEIVSGIAEFKIQAIISHVENASALAVLWQLGVDYIQGDYLAPPARKMDYEFTDIA